MSIITAAILLVYGGVLLVVDLFVGVLLAATVPIALWIAVQGTQVTGEVVSVGERSAGGSTRVRVSYTTAGGNFETRGTTRRPHLGAQVPVRYHRSRPEVATTMIHPLRWAVVGLPTVLVIAAVSIGMLTSAVWYFSGSHTQLQEPLGGGSFMFGIALACGYYAAKRYALFLHWHRMVQAEGKVRRYKEPAGSKGSGRILISFQSASGHEEFWVQAGSAPSRVGDTIMVYYDTDRPADTATVQEAFDVRSGALYSTGFAVLAAALGVWALTAL